MRHTTAAFGRAQSDARTEAGEMTRTVPAEVRAYLGAPPLISGENPEAHEELLARVGGAVRPKDAVEWLCVADVVNLTWEAQRLRRLKAKLLNAARQEAVERLVERTSASGGA